jgi:hypothetical protein
MTTLPYVQETRATVRRRIGRLLKSLIYGTALSGTSSTVVLDAAKRYPDNAQMFVGSLAYIVSGTGVGQARVVESTVQATGAVTVTPDWATPPDATSVIEIWQTFDPDEVNDAIDLAVLSAQELVWVSTRVNPTLISSDFKAVTLPSGLIAVTGFYYQTTTANVYKTYKLGQHSDYLTEHPATAVLQAGQLLLNPALTADIALGDQWITGYALPALPTSDSDTLKIRSDYLSLWAAAHIEASRAEGGQLDPEDHSSRASNWLRMAMALRISLGTQVDPDTQIVGS